MFIINIETISSEKNNITTTLMISESLFKKANTLSARKVDRVTILSSFLIFINEFTDSSSESMESAIIDSDFELAFIFKATKKWGKTNDIKVLDVISSKNIYLTKGFSSILAGEVFDNITVKER